MQTPQSAAGFLIGYDAALGYSLLRGFHEWLIVKYGLAAVNAHWAGFLVHVVNDEFKGNPKLASKAIFDIVVDFLGEFENLADRRRVYDELERRLADRSQQIASSLASENDE